MADATEMGLGMIDRSYRKIIVVLVVLLTLGGGSFSAWAYAQSEVTGVIDDRLDRKVIPRLDRHDQQIAALEVSDRKTRDDVAEIRSDIRYIRTLVEERLPAKKR